MFSPYVDQKGKNHSEVLVESPRRHEDDDEDYDDRKERRRKKKAPPRTEENSIYSFLDEAQSKKKNTL